MVDNQKQRIQLLDLVNYQKDSIVSKIIIEKKTGTVSLFAFDKNQGLSEHIAPFDALVHLIDGEAEIVISDKTVNLKNGEMIIMPANQPHALKAVQRFKMILTMIKS
jgi:quercetin dioxygenase-like cupin family protein|tara:strand:- start:2940 stop:3260 length:321 start_codon:yes stop_codon:yes gene_type:complete